MRWQGGRSGADLPVFARYFFNDADHINVCQTGITESFSQFHADRFMQDDINDQERKNGGYDRSVCRAHPSSKAGDRHTCNHSSGTW